MDLNHIELSTEIISQLYKNHLIEEPSAETSQQVSPIDQNSLTFIGKNHKNIALVIQTSGKSLPKLSLDFLYNLLIASNLKDEDIALINKSDNPHLSYNLLIENLKARSYYFWGRATDSECTNQFSTFPGSGIQWGNSPLCSIS